MTAANEHRLESWIDALPLDDQPRAKLLSGMPAPMAVANVDRDLRLEMHAIENRLVKEIRSIGQRPLSKKALTALAVIGGGIVQAVIAAVHQVKP